MGKSSPSPPPAPDYTAAATATAAADKQIAAQTNFANRPNINTPWGGQNWTTSSMTDPSTGQPVTQWTQNNTLTPDAQSALNAQLDVDKGKSELAQSFQGRVGDAFANDFDWQGLPAAGQIGDAGSGIDNALETINQLRSPEVGRRREGLESQLANQGLTQGSEAYNTEMGRLADEENRGDLQAQMSAGQFADAQQSRELNAANYANQLRQQGIGEQQLARGMPLNEMNAVLTGAQVQQPQMPTFQRSTGSQAPDYLGVAGAQYQGGLDQYNAQAGARSNAMSGLFGMAGQGLSAAAPFMLSDKRVKHLVAKLHDIFTGVPVYIYEYIGSAQRLIGVLAQDLVKVRPDAVLKINGLYTVNYGAI